MAVYVSREREVEGGVGIKVWSGARMPPSASEVSIVVVERYSQGVYGGRW